MNPDIDKEMELELETWTREVYEEACGTVDVPEDDQSTRKDEQQDQDNPPLLETTSSPPRQQSTPYQGKRCFMRPSPPLRNEQHPFYQYIDPKIQRKNDICIKSMMNDADNGTDDAPRRLYALVEESEELVRRELRPGVSRSVRRHKEHFDKEYRMLTGIIRAMEGLNISQPLRGGPVRLRMQNDLGANRSITNDRQKLLRYRALKQPYPIGGVNSEGPALYATGVGYIPWKARCGRYILVRCLYSKEADGTIISPTDICQQYSKYFDGIRIHCSVNTKKTGFIDFMGHDGRPTRFDMYLQNGLWWHHLDVGGVQQEVDREQYGARVHAAQARHQEYVLWHNRLGHPGENIMGNIHRYVDGIPHLRPNRMWKCGSCVPGKFAKQTIGKARKAHDKGTQSRTWDPGQGLHMDFGFVRGSKWKEKDEQGNTITSIDGYRSYLLIVDRATRYKWLFLTKRKTPPIEQVSRLLEAIDCKSKGKYIMTDLGGELAKSHLFQQMIEKSGYTLRVTGAGSSEANGIVERVHRDLGNMMRTMLHGAGLGPEYWSFAIIHAIYLMNRWPHSAIKMTPYQAMFGSRPDVSHLRTFGSLVHALKPNKKRAKLDARSEIGIFLHYAGSKNTLIIRDKRSGKFCTTRHAILDEAHTTVAAQDRPPMARDIIEAGYIHPESGTKTDKDVMRVKLLSSNATKPTKASDEAAGYDLYAATDATLVPGERITIPTDVAIECPPGTYGQIAARSGLARKYGIIIPCGVIDADYRGNVGVVLHNTGRETLQIHSGDRIAQLILMKIDNPTIEVATELTDTTRGSSGFGSTGKGKLQEPQHRVIPLPDITDMESTVYGARAAKLDGEDMVQLSSNPYDDELTINVPKSTKKLRQRHDTLGFVLQSCPNRGLPVITQCKQGTPAGKIPRWRSSIRDGYLLRINDTTIDQSKSPAEMLEQATKCLQQYTQNTEEVTLRIGLIEKINMHPTEGTPMIYFDQIGTIGRHIHEMKQEDWWNRETNLELYDDYLTKYSEALISDRDKAQSQLAKAMQLKGILPKSKCRKHKLTRRKLQRLPEDEWKIWEASEHKQLDQYEQQEMFGTPCPLPPGANCLPLLWTYLIKDDGRKKARCVCNGAPSRSGSVTLGHTYAGSLEQCGNRIFWAAAALKNMVVYGADASNAFAEAPPPKAPLYVTVDQQYREWWASKSRKPIPKGYVLPVRRALQGHPESSRLWSQLIDSVLRMEPLNFKPAVHEQCLYHGHYKGKEVLFLRQVDDFCVATEDEETAKEVISIINDQMTIDVKHLGLIDRFNGVDIQQTRHYVKIHGATYINKILSGHGWTESEKQKKPIPIHYDSKYSARIEQAKAPLTTEEKIKLQRKMGFNYRQAIGELLYAMVTCRPDIGYACIKLSQYATDPAEIHYEAVRNIFSYLAQTVHHGIYYWRKEPNETLPIGKMPRLQQDDHPESAEDVCLSPTNLKGYVDSDWAGDTKHRRSVTGFAMELAGGTIHYKCKFQNTCSLSSCESEFNAACEAAKAIKYIRSILEALDIEQMDATTLFIDNNGALLLADAKQPSRRTKHMDIKHFRIQEWVEQSIIAMKRINTTDNRSDALSKALTPRLFYRHMDKIMGRRIPKYAHKALKKR